VFVVVGEGGKAAIYDEFDFHKFEWPWTSGFMLPWDRLVRKPTAISLVVCLVSGGLALFMQFVFKNYKFLYLN